MDCAERVADHVDGATVVAAGLFQRREAQGFPSNTILAVTDTPALYAFHRDPRDGLNRDGRRRRGLPRVATRMARRERQGLTQKRCATARLLTDIRCPYQVVWYGDLL